MRSPVLLVALTLTSVLPDIALYAQTDTAGGLRLAPGDRVRVEVAGDSTLSGDFDVDAAGMVLVPLVGLVPVAGRPFEDVASLVIAGFDAELVGACVGVSESPPSASSSPPHAAKTSKNMPIIIGIEYFRSFLISRLLLYLDRQFAAFFESAPRPERESFPLSH